MQRFSKTTRSSWLLWKWHEMCPRGPNRGQAGMGGVLYRAHGAVMAAHIYMYTLAPTLTPSPIFVDFGMLRQHAYQIVAGAALQIASDAQSTCVCAQLYGSAHMWSTQLSWHNLSCWMIILRQDPCWRFRMKWAGFFRLKIASSLYPSLCRMGRLYS